MAVISDEVNLKDGISGPAKAASNEITALSKALSTAQDKLTVASAMGDIKAYKSASQSVANLKAALSALPPAQEQVKSSSSGMGKSLADSGKASGGLAKAFDGAADAIRVGKESIGAAFTGIKSAFASLAQGDVKGAIAGVTDAISGMAKMLDMVVPGLGEVVSAVVSIVGGLVGASVGLVVSGAKFAVAASQAKQQMLSMFDAMGGGVVTGEQVDDMLSNLSDRIRISKDELAPLTQAFLQMGVTSVDALEKLTTAAISAEAITKGGAAAFTDLQKKIQLAVETGQGFKLGTKQLLGLRAAGVGVSEIAVKMGMTTQQLTAGLKAGTIDAKKFGDAMTEAVIAKGAKPLERMASSFDAVKKKFDQDIGDLFEDIDVGPFMKEVKDLFGIFGQGTESGKAMKAGIGAFFKEVFADATKVVPLVKHFLLDMVIYGIKAYIAAKPIIGWFKELQQNQTVMSALSMAFDTVATVLKVMAIGIGFAIVRFVALLAAIGAIAVALFAAMDAVASFTGDALKALAGWASAAATMAVDFIAGLVNGITSGASSVVDSVTNIASKAKDAFKNALGIASPSKVMLEAGDNVSAGVALGIQGGASDVKAASTDMANAVTAPMASLVAPAINAPSLNAGVPDVKAPALAPSPAAPLAIPDVAEARGPSIDPGSFAPAEPKVHVIQAPGGEGGGGGGTIVNIEPGAIVINGANKSIDDISLEAMSAAFEQAAMHAGTDQS